MLTLQAVILGGAGGLISRHLICPARLRGADTAFPVGPLATVRLASLTITLPWCLLEDSGLTNAWRLCIFTGLRAGFTTFSTFALENTQHFTAGKWRTGLLYRGISNSMALLRLISGCLVARRCQLAA